MIINSNIAPKLCGFTYEELVNLRGDLTEAFIFKNWTDKYDGKIRKRLRRCLGLSDE